VESTCFARSGLSDDPNLEMELAPKPPHYDGPASGGGGALFPEIPTWSDEQPWSPSSWRTAASRG
jgi:hypothetical protein